MITNETIYETYIREICSNCKNRTTNLCNIVMSVKGKLQCIYYDKDKDVTGYVQFKGRTANQSKPVMKGIDK